MLSYITRGGKLGLHSKPRVFYNNIMICIWSICVLTCINLFITLKLSLFRRKVIEKYVKTVINRWLNTLNICVAYWYFENGILSKGGADAMLKWFLDIGNSDDFWISVNEFRISVNELWISVNEFRISVNEFRISVIQLNFRYP